MGNKALSVETLFIFLVVILNDFCVAIRLHGDPYVGLSYVDSKPTFNSEPRIIGGEEVDIVNVPWQVSIENQYYQHFCGGAIINKLFILTAASCVVGLQPRNLRILTGTSDWRNLTNPEYLVDHIVIHCNFDKPLYHNDIALLKLKEPIIFNDVTQIVSIAEIDELEEGDRVSFTGWGSTVLSGNYPNSLRKLHGFYVPYNECKKAHGGTEDVDLGHLCVKQAVGQGICHGDTGGPLVNENGVLVGISNWGVPCAYGFPDVFARVVFYTDWIRSTILGCHHY